MAGMGMMGMGAEDDSESESEVTDDFGSAIMEAMPDQEWTPDRLAAMKAAIKLCLEQDKAGEYEDEGEEGGKGKPGLALIFGAKPKKG